MTWVGVVNPLSSFGHYLRNHADFSVSVASRSAAHVLSLRVPVGSICAGTPIFVKYVLMALWLIRCQRPVFVKWTNSEALFLLMPSGVGSQKNFSGRILIP